MADVKQALIREARLAVRRAKRCAGLLADPAFVEAGKKWKQTLQEIGADAHSGGFIGYHARVYMRGLRPRRAGEVFDLEWGGQEAFGNSTRGDWVEYMEFDDFRRDALARAGLQTVPEVDVDRVGSELRLLLTSIESMRPLLAAFLKNNADPYLQIRADDLNKLELVDDEKTIVNRHMPRMRQATRDPRAQASQAIEVPQHVRLLVAHAIVTGVADGAGRLKTWANDVLAYMEHAYPEDAKAPEAQVPDITAFIGHGRDGSWKDLKDCLENRLGLRTEVFESGEAHTVSQRLNDMLDASDVAFLVLTGEDVHADGTKHARQNVMHEVGLFQGRLTDERVVLLVEHDCVVPSNPPNEILAGSERIRMRLEHLGVVERTNPDR